MALAPPAGADVFTPADLRRLHKYMLEIEKVTVISDEKRAVVENEWPELAHKLPLAKPANVRELCGRGAAHCGRP